VADVKQVTVPDIGDFADVAVVEVHVGPGDNVAQEDALVTLETDKATMDVPAPFAGVIQDVLLKVGDTASEGTPVVTLTLQADAAAPTEAAAPGAVRGAVAAEASSRPREGGATAPPPTPPGEPAPPAAATPPAPATPAPAASDANGAGPIYASPSVRRLARELGVDLHAVHGSGRKGRILPEDVRALPNGPAPGATVPAGGGVGGLDLLPWPQIDFEKFGEVERVPLSRIRKLSAANLARNWVYIPHVTHNDDADVTELEAFRKQLNAEQSDVKVTMVALLLKASVAALQKFPDMNSSLDGDDLVHKKYYHLGFAADTPNGLVVPVIRDVDKKGILEVAGELTELSGKARAGKLGPNEMAGATFTISSLGGIGGTSFTPIVNAPQVGILGAVRAAMKPVWDGKEFVPRLMLPLSLSYDHRVIDGAAAARFVTYLAGVLADLRRVLL
jgi:pyruvate dehydrogenase E2 component (dihydrolipoamide acetyltransferase)